MSMLQVGIMEVLFRPPHFMDEKKLRKFSSEKVQMSMLQVGTVEVLFKQH